MAPVSEQRTKRGDAADFLREELAEGGRPTKDLKGAARGAGIGWRTIEDAKSDLGIRASKSSFNGGWIWELPEDQDRTPHISDSAVFADSASQRGIQGRDGPEDRKTATDRDGSAELEAVA
jgi:hypothetical protein